MFRISITDLRTTSSAKQDFVTFFGIIYSS